MFGSFCSTNTCTGLFDRFGGDEMPEVDSKYIHVWQNYKIKLESLPSRYDQFYRMVGEPFICMSISEFYESLKKLQNREWTTMQYLDREIEVEVVEKSHFYSVMKQDQKWYAALEDKTSQFNLFFEVEGLLAYNSS